MPILKKLHQEKHEQSSEYYSTIYDKLLEMYDQKNMKKEIVQLKKEHSIASQNNKTANQNPHTSTNNIKRNAPCPCGSGKKYKKCCIQNKSKF